MFAEAVVHETFPVEVRLADIFDVCRVMSLFSDPALDFGPESVKIVERDFTAEAVYPFAKPGMIYQQPMTATRKIRTYGV